MSTVRGLWKMYSAHIFFLNSSYFGIITPSNVYRMGECANLNLFGNIAVCVFFVVGSKLRYLECKIFINVS